MTFKIYEVENGILLSVYRKQQWKSYVYKPEERIYMFAFIDQLMGVDPGDPDKTNQEKANE